MQPAATDNAIDTKRWSAAKLALLQKRLAAAAVSAPAGPLPLAGGAARRNIPLSPVQHGIWAIDQVLDDNAVYSVHRVLRLRGELDVAALRAALDDLARRHEILRTVYAGSPPAQQVMAAGPVDVTLVDLAQQAPAAAARKALRLAGAELAEPFDLAEGPLLRCLLVTVAAGEYLLVINTHHIVNDEWSFGVLARDLSGLYTAHASGDYLD